LFSLRVGCHIFITFCFHEPDTHLPGIHSWGQTHFQFVLRYFLVGQLKLTKYCYCQLCRSRRSISCSIWLLDLCPCGLFQNPGKIHIVCWTKHFKHTQITLPAFSIPVISFCYSLNLPQKIPMSIVKRHYLLVIK
jgi:hypothetical protein